VKDIINMLIRLAVLTAIVTVVWLAYINREDVIGTYETLLASLPRFEREAAQPETAAPVATETAAAAAPATGEVPAVVAEHDYDEASGELPSSEGADSPDAVGAAIGATGEQPQPPAVKPAPQTVQPAADKAGRDVRDPGPPGIKSATPDGKATGVIGAGRERVREGTSITILDAELDTYSEPAAPASSGRVGTSPEEPADKPKASTRDEQGAPEPPARAPVMMPEKAAGTPLPEEDSGDDAADELPPARAADSDLQPGPPGLPAPGQVLPEQDDRGQLVNEARRAAWQGRHEESVKLYRRILAGNPDDIDAWGEMGNVLLRMQRGPEAARAYHQAGLRLAANGRFRQSRQLLSTLRRLDPDLATDLETHLQQGRPSLPANRGDDAYTAPAW